MIILVERSVQMDSFLETSSAASLVQIASRFKSRISLVAEEKTANAKSIMGLISLDLQSGNVVKIIAEGEDEQQVLPEIENVLLNLA